MRTCIYFQKIDLKFLIKSFNLNKYFEKNYYKLRICTKTYLTVTLNEQVRKHNSCKKTSNCYVVWHGTLNLDVDNLIGELSMGSGVNNLEGGITSMRSIIGVRRISPCGQ